jgi:iron-sulfur cluster assembly accessory protein
LRERGGKLNVYKHQRMKNTMGCKGCPSDQIVNEVEPKTVEMPTDKPLITLTESAAAKVKEFMKEAKDKTGLRIMVVPGGCAGYQYGMDFDNKKDSDITLEQYGITLLIDKKSATHLVGTSIDFVDNLQDSGFKIENPNATQGCGCGKSFS